MQTCSRLPQCITSIYILAQLFDNAFVFLMLSKCFLCEIDKTSVESRALCCKNALFGSVYNSQLSLLVYCSHAGARILTFLSIYSMSKMYICQWNAILLYLAYSRSGKHFTLARPVKYYAMISLVSSVHVQENKAVSII